MKQKLKASSLVHIALTYLPSWDPILQYLENMKWFQIWKQIPLLLSQTGSLNSIKTLCWCLYVCSTTNLCPFITSLAIKLSCQVFTVVRVTQEKLLSVCWFVSLLHSTYKHHNNSRRLKYAFEPMHLILVFLFFYFSVPIIWGCVMWSV